MGHGENSNKCYYKEKITRLVYNHGTHPTRTIDGSAGIMGVSGGFLRNFGALGGT